jgi:hypothetical protein
VIQQIQQGCLSMNNYNWLGMLMLLGSSTYNLQSKSSSFGRL